jgi:CHASE3 domain sensor protein
MKLTFRRFVELPPTGSVMFVLCFFAILFLLASTYVQRTQGAVVRREQQRIVEARQAIVLRERSFGSLSDAESAMYGYIITDEAAYLVKYRSSQGVTERTLSLLLEVSNNAEQQQQLRLLMPLVTHRFRQLDDLRQVREVEGTEGASLFLRGDTGVTLTDEIQRRFERLASLQDEALSEFQIGAQTAEASLLTTFWGVRATGFFLLAAIGLLGLQIAASERLVKQQSKIRDAEMLRQVIVADGAASESRRELENLAQALRYYLPRPLNGLRGALIQLQSSMFLGPREQEACQRLEYHLQALDRLQRTVDKLCVVLLIEPSIGAVDVLALLRQAVADASQQAPCDYSLNTGGSVYVLTDRRLFRLLIEALVAFVWEPAQRHIALRVDDRSSSGELVFYGPAVTPSRAASERSYNLLGTLYDPPGALEGGDLALCKRIMVALGGSLEHKRTLENEIFFLRLPIVPGREATAEGFALPDPEPLEGDVDPDPRKSPV